MIYIAGKHHDKDLLNVKELSLILKASHAYHHCCIDGVTLWGYV